MVDIDTQTISNTEVNSRDLSPSKNDTSLAMIMNKIQIECLDLHSTDRDVINSDPAIVSIGRSDDHQRLQHNCNRCHSSDEQNYDTSNKSNYHCQTHTDDHQQINVVDQMIDQPHIPYILLPKHFKPKQISNNQNQQQSSLLKKNNYGIQNSQRQNYFKDNDQKHERMIHREFVPTNRYDKPCRNYYYNSYSYRPPQIRSHLSINTAPSYDINKWQDPYAQSLDPQQQRGGFRRNNDNCIRDDHRINISKRKSRNDEEAKDNKINDKDY